MKITIILIALTIIAFFSLSSLLLASPATDISQDDFIARQQVADDFVLLDVRTKAEFEQGHIKGAVNFSHAELSDHLQDIPKDKDLIIYCRSGKRAGVAATLLSKNGYQKLFHLDGDMNGWIKNNRAVVND